MLYKNKGSPDDPANYRGVCIQSAALKLFMRMILNRLRSALDCHLGESQMGFRPGRNTVMAIFVARRLFEEIALLQPGEFPAILIVVDFIKAFDSVLRDALWAVLARARVPTPLITVIRTLYEGSTTSVRTQHGITPPCPLQTGVLQGCVLSPYLFFIVADYVMRQACARFASMAAGRAPGLAVTNELGEGGPTNRQTLLADLIYADDIMLIEKPESAQLWLDCHAALEARAVGLEISPKTEALALGMELRAPTHTPPLRRCRGQLPSFRPLQAARQLASRLQGRHDDTDRHGMGATP
eukprot:jgi/Mesvir1/12817/Mv26220-RA.1